MEYQIGNTGRIVVARLFEGENLYENIEDIALRENINSAAVLITGGFRKAEVVVGPKQETPKIVGDMRTFNGPGEVLGVGTIYWDDQRPKLHIHTAMGKGDNAMVGCPRGGAETFLIMEVTIFEIMNLDARRIYDKKTGLNLLRLIKSDHNQT